MSPELALFARTFVIGIAVAAPVGAMGVLCINRTLSYGWRGGFATGLGIATADMLWAGVAAFGVASISSKIVAWQVPLQLIGGTILTLMGLISLLSRPKESSEEPELPAGGSLYATALGLTLTNPMTIMAFGAVFASAGLATAATTGSGVIATLGVGLGSLFWWVTLTTVVSRLHHALDARALSWVRRVSGLVIALFGVYAVVNAMVGR